MKLNERSVVHYATGGVPPDKAGYLLKKSERSGTFQRRWCVLKANLLFLFEERGRREPLGLVVLEGCTVELCENERVDFAFAVRFGLGHAHTLAADTQAEMEDWAKALARASFQYLRLLVRELERQLDEAQKRHGDEGGTEGGADEGEGAAAPRPDPLGRENGISWIEPSRSEEVVRDSCSVSWGRGMVTNGVAWEGDCGARGRAPPLPPRRKSPPEVGVSHRQVGMAQREMCVPHREVSMVQRDMGVSHRELGVSPGTTCFSKLHEWYGQEVAQVRREWLQSQ